MIDGKGEREFLDDKLLPLVAAAGRLDDLRIIDPSRPEISVRFNPFVAPCENYHEHVNFIFESFDLRDDFFKEHQKTYMSDIVRILYYTGKRYNFYDILVMTYDLDVIKEQAAIAARRIEQLPGISHQQKLSFEMSVHNLVASFEDSRRVEKVRGAINEMMKFLEDKLSIITGPYEDLISIEDVIEQGQILVVSLNTNKDDSTTKALGRMILQNLQLVIGNRYERKRAGMYMPFVSVIMDEFAPIAYSNFANILQTARGSNTAFLFAMQSVPQLLTVGKAFQHDVASAPNTTFMLRTRDEDTSQYFLQASARVRQIRRSMSVRRTGIFNATYEDQGVGSETEIKDTRSQEEHIKNLPVGQLEYLMSDQYFGTIHGHMHVRAPRIDRLAIAPGQLLPRYRDQIQPGNRSQSAFPARRLGSQPQAGDAHQAKGSGMKAALWVSTLLLAVSSASLAQRLPNHGAIVSNQSQTDDATARVERQRRYDPQAGVPAVRPGIFENSLKSINKQEVDYGAQLAKWRQVMVESTLQSVTYWTTIALAGGLLLACTYILCLLRERDRRLEITTNIVTQIINWYYYTRSHALNAIERHNTLIEEYNTVAEQLATLRTQRRGSEVLEALLRTEAAGIPLAELDAEEAAHERNTQSSASNSRENDESASAEPTTSLQTAHREQTESSPANRLVVTTEQLERIREQARNDSRTLVAGQVNALSQKNNNLRAQLNEALRKVGQLENQCKAQASNREMRPG